VHGISIGCLGNVRVRSPAACTHSESFVIPASRGFGPRLREQRSVRPVRVQAPPSFWMPRSSCSPTRCCATSPRVPTWSSPHRRERRGHQAGSTCAARGVPPPQRTDRIARQGRRRPLRPPNTTQAGGVDLRLTPGRRRRPPAARYGGLSGESWRIYNQADIVAYLPVDTSDSYQPVTAGTRSTPEIRAVEPRLLPRAQHLPARPVPTTVPQNPAARTPVSGSPVAVGDRRHSTADSIPARSCSTSSRYSVRTLSDRC
jgi:hypothetical protein